MPNTPRLALPYPVSTDTADVPRDLKALADRVEALTAWIRQSDFAPGVGAQPGDLRFTAIAVAAPTAVADWLLCDGGSYLRTGTYATLFAAIGTAYGAADATHFSVPDFKGMSPMGAGAGVDPGPPGTPMPNRALAARVGASTHKLAVTDLPWHEHFLSDDAPYSTGSRNYGAGSGGPTLYDGIQAINKLTGSNWTPSATGHNNVGPSLVVNVLIKI
jgi:microcystin-dependent protein